MAGRTRSPRAVAFILPLGEAAAQRLGGLGFRCRTWLRERGCLRLSARSPPSREKTPRSVGRCFVESFPVSPPPKKKKKKSTAPESWLRADAPASPLPGDSGGPVLGVTAHLGSHARWTKRLQHPTPPPSGLPGVTVAPPPPNRPPFRCCSVSKQIDGSRTGNRAVARRAAAPCAGSCSAASERRAARQIRSAHKRGVGRRGRPGGAAPTTGSKRRRRQCVVWGARVGAGDHVASRGHRPHPAAAASLLDARAARAALRASGEAR
jgi:hypothetical protein